MKCRLAKGARDGGHSPLLSPSLPPVRAKVPTVGLGRAQRDQQARSPGSQPGLTIELQDPEAPPCLVEHEVHDGVAGVIRDQHPDVFVSWETSQTELPGLGRAPLRPHCLPQAMPPKSLPQLMHTHTHTHTCVHTDTYTHTQSTGVGLLGFLKGPPCRWWTGDPADQDRKTPS